MRSGSRPTSALVDLGSLRKNFSSCKAFIGADLKYMAVVKADAYGHGGAACGRALASAGVDWLAVATLDEAVELRGAGIDKPILCLGGCWPGDEGRLIEHGITPAVFEMIRAAELNSAAGEAGRIIPVHIKIDTGMGRLGFKWNSAAEIADAFLQFKNLAVEGIMTHFASADDLEASDFTGLQAERFHEAVAAFRSADHAPECVDLANSPGAVVRGADGGNMVRLGGLLYGLSGDILPQGVRRPDLTPVMSVVSEIAHLKEISPGESVGYGRTFIAESRSLIAAVPIGYYDGYRRALSNQAHMIVNGHVAPVVGRISMDWTTIDVTNIPNAAIGDRVTVIGGGKNAWVRAEDLAMKADTISYEITCGISRRVPRLYVGDTTDSGGLTG